MTRASAAVGSLLFVTLVLLAPGSASPSSAADGVPPAAVASPTAEACPERPTARPSDPPVLAHFYIWFTTPSWNRAKTDYPAIGRYASDSVDVMEEQVAQAQAAGIDGFIVGWKSTPTLDARLQQLRDVAARRNFTLAVTYQAQDFHRRPLPVERVRADLEILAARYAGDPVFQLLGPRPLVALSGTWHYSAEELRSITAPVASRLVVLATEKNVEGYQRVASAVEGELYYWSSPDPLETPGYLGKLLDMANAVRESCGLWVAPVAPGFDARLVGGRSVVERRDGETLRASWQAALATIPDAVGVISWNEFSENTHIEPSDRHGTRYVEALAGLTTAPLPPPKALDSDSPADSPAVAAGSGAADGTGTGSALRAALSAVAVIGLALAVTVVGIRRRREDRPPSASS